MSRVQVLTSIVLYQGVCGVNNDQIVARCPNRLTKLATGTENRTNSKLHYVKLGEAQRGPVEEES